MDTRRLLRLALLPGLALLFLTLVALADANNVSESGADDQALAFTVPAPTDTPGDVPPECAGMTFDNVIYGAGNISGTNHADLIFGSDGDDVIDAGNGDDCLVGLGGNDVLSGGRQGDVLLGGDGDDILDGGQHTDTCYGGAGNNIFANCESIP